MDLQNAESVGRVLSPRAFELASSRRNTWNRESNESDVVKVASYNCLSIPKRTRRSPEENEDTYVCFSRNAVTIVGVFDGHSSNSLSVWLKLHVEEVFAEVSSTFPTDPDQYGSLSCDLPKIWELFPSAPAAAERLSSLEKLIFPNTLTLCLALTLAIAEERAICDATVDTATAGSCVTLVAIDRSAGSVQAAFLGDSAFAVYTTDDVTLRYRSSEHRLPHRKDEAARVLAAGGRIFRNRAIGMEWSSLAVTRSLGDTLWKAGDFWVRDASVGKSGKRSLDPELVDFSRSRGCIGVSSDPELVCLDDLPRTFSLVVASDGFWDTTNGSVKSPLFESARALVSVAPPDDVTLIVLEIQPSQRQ